MRFGFAMLIMVLLGLSGKVYAEEVSFVSGFFRSQDNTPGFAQKTISLGGRYGFAVNEDKRFWFIDAGIESTSYSGDNAPDGSSGIRLGAGQKYFMRNFGKAIHTFLSWSAGFQNKSNADTVNKTETSALYYAGTAGFRFDFSKTFFFDTEAELFNSSLVETTKTEPIAGGAGSKSKVTELQVATFSGANSLTFGVGMLF